MKKFSKLLKNKHLRGAAAYTLCIWGPVTSFATLWGVPFVQAAYRVDVSFTATICSMLWLGSAFGSPLIGCLSDMIQGSRRMFMNLCGLVGTMTAILIVYWHVDNMILLGALFFIFGVSTGGQALSFAYLRDHIDDADIGAASGINNMATVAGGAILPILIGSIIHWSWNGEFDSVQEIPLYQGVDYQWALFVIPLCHFMALNISYFWLGSTRKLNEVKQAA